MATLAKLPREASDSLHPGDCIGSWFELEFRLAPTASFVPSKEVKLQRFFGGAELERAGRVLNPSLSILPPGHEAELRAILIRIRQHANANERRFPRSGAVIELRCHLYQLLLSGRDR